MVRRCKTDVFYIVPEHLRVMQPEWQAFKDEAGSLCVLPIDQVRQTQANGLVFAV